ncbi:sporulation and cell division protein, SsgA [Frankia sp. EI5c]|uniref:SsgA family sporulation/cell division regulator n=1 Tax=Frankia sp. EI5c TaxID=683316 RepID=UPI0007C2F9BD|nr:SsgA family sporulation/cell division regulator [Frankia sp. EI5c]OAA28102.1 sporulation and cell division protein, SsgA [Frankia sp. EI5c]
MQVEDVTTEFVVDDAPGRGRITVLQVIWRSCDPLAVALVLVSRPDHPALPQGHWVAPRDALRAGLEGPAPVGDGDVRITPDPSRGGIRLELANGERRSVVVLDAAPVRSFLDRTERVVPAGEEHTEVALDAVLDDLLQT